MFIEMLKLSTNEYFQLVNRFDIWLFYFWPSVFDYSPAREFCSRRSPKKAQFALSFQLLDAFSTIRSEEKYF